MGCTPHLDEYLEELTPIFVVELEKKFVMSYANFYDIGKVSSLCHLMELVTNRNEEKERRSINYISYLSS